MIEAAAKSAKLSESEWSRSTLLAALPSAGSGQGSVSHTVSRLKAQISSSKPLVENSQAVSWDTFLELLRKWQEIAQQSTPQNAKDLIQAYRAISTTMRQLVRNQKTAGAIEELIHQCVGSCHLLADEQLRDEVTVFARAMPYFPVVWHGAPVLNRRLKAVLDNLKLSEDIQGYRKDAKWIDDEFFPYALAVVDHLGMLLYHSLANPNEAKTAQQTQVLSALVTFVKAVKNGNKAPKMIKQTLWKCIDEYVIGKKSQPIADDLWRCGFCWEDLFTVKSLINAVGSTNCTAVDSRGRAEIKKRLDHKIFDIFDRCPP